MNERIKYLVEKANARAFINEDGSLTPELKTFTELVVKECANMLDEDSYLIPELGGYAHDMRKRFGVEE